MSDQIPTAVEEFRPVPGYEGRYSVSNLGRVKSHVQNKGQETVDGILKPVLGKRGYYFVGLHGLNTHKSFKVHRLVMTAFREPDPARPHINHKNGNKLLNTLDNLEWTNDSENQLHRYRVLGLRSCQGSKHGMAKLTESQVLEIRRRLSMGERNADISREFRIHPVHVSEIKRRKIWRHLPIEKPGLENFVQTELNL